MNTFAFYFKPGQYAQVPGGYRVLPKNSNAKMSVDQEQGVTITAELSETVARSHSLWRWAERVTDVTAGYVVKDRELDAPHPVSPATGGAE